jgi:hypothetical protein
MMASHRRFELNPKDTESFEEVKEMLATRLESWERTIRLEAWNGGVMAMFYKVLVLKYGPLPSWAQDKIAEADTATIEQWATKLLNAQTLDKVFDPDI